MTQYDTPTAWVSERAPAIKSALDILGLSLEGARSTLGSDIATRATKDTLGALSLSAQDRLQNLLTGMGLFNGRLAPEGQTPDYRLVVVSGLHRLTDILPTLLGQDFICLPPSRDWKESEDGPRGAIEAAAQKFANSKWCQWANSPGAFRQRDTLYPSTSGPHVSLYGLTALGIVHASRGEYDLARVAPRDMTNTRFGFPDYILLSSNQGSATIYPRMGVGRGSEWADLKHWVNRVARDPFLHVNPHHVIHVVTHSTSVLRIEMYAQEILATQWPDCQIDIVAPPVHPGDRHAWLREALQELAFLIGRSE